MVYIVPFLQEPYVQRRQANLLVALVHRARCTDAGRGSTLYHAISIAILLSRDSVKSRGPHLGISTNPMNFK